jgi:hypothetical protein
MAKISWTNSSGGTWSVGSNWSNGAVPGPNDTVTIAIAPGQGLASYTVELNTDAVVKSLALDQAAATLLVGDGSGDGTLATQLKLQAGTLALDSGTLTGLVAETGGTLTLTDLYQQYAAIGTLQNVTWQGDLVPVLNLADAFTGQLNVLGGLTLTGAGGKGPGTLTLLQQDVGVNFIDTQTLDNATVNLGFNLPGGGAAYISTQTDGNAPANLTLGSHLLIDVVGSADIYDGGQITNDGSISTAGTASLDFAQGSAGSTFTNAGLIALNDAAYATIQVPDFINTGSITVAAGALLDLNFSYYGISSFQNTGVFADHGTVQVDGTLTSAQLQGLNIDYGTTGTLALSQDSTLTNTGFDIALGSGGIANLNVDGTILGGVLTENGGGLTASNGTLSGVAVHGPFSLGGSYSTLFVVGGLQLNPGATLSVTGYQDTLNFASSTEIDQADIVLGSAGGDTLEASYGTTLTLGTSVQTNVATGAAYFAGYFGGGSIVNDGAIGVSNGAIAFFGQDSTAFLNQGSISASAGGTLYLDSGFANDGAVSVTDGSLLLGDVNASLLGGLTLANSLVGIVGTLDATGTTVNVGQGTELGDVLIGVANPEYGGSGAGIQGGTIHDAGGGLRIEGTVALTGVTYQGVLSDAAPYSTLVVSDLTLENAYGTGTGTLVLTGAQSVLLIAAGATLDNATVDLGSAINHQGGTTLSAPTIEAQGVGGPPILGAHLVIDQTAKYAGLGGNSDDFVTVSDATINAAFKGGQMLLNGDIFVSGGTINIGAGEVVTSAAGSFTNTGSVSIASGGTLTLNLLNYYLTLPDSGTSFENEGQMVLTGGTITEQSGKGVPQVPLRNDSAANISGVGVIEAEIVNYGTVTASGGELTLSQAISGSGVLDVAASATLSLLASVSAGETAQFGGADGVLGLSAKHFLGEIGGFAKGDTIDLFKLHAKAASFVGSSIAVTLANGSTISLALTAPGSGSLTVTGDGNGGSLIAFAGVAAHPALVPAVPETAVPVWAPPETLTDKISYWESMSHHWSH